MLVHKNCVACPTSVKEKIIIHTSKTTISVTNDVKSEIKISMTDTWEIHIYFCCEN